jgi:GNAT superfamily N-acetyltransferase
MYRVIRAATEHDEAITAISDTVFGIGFLPDLPTLRTTHMGFVACWDGEVAGFVFGELHDEASFQRRLHNIGAVPSLPLYGVVDPLAVAPAHQGRGVGGRLLEAVTAALQELGASFLAAPAWGYRREGCVHVNAAPLLWANGFNLRTVASRYWQVPCERGEFTCLHKTNPCTCSLNVYCKDLRPKD